MDQINVNMYIKIQLNSISSDPIKDQITSSIIYLKEDCHACGINNKVAR